MDILQARLASAYDGAMGAQTLAFSPATTRAVPDDRANCGQL